HFALEMERIHFRMWLYAGRADELPEPGSFLTWPVAGENGLILRDPTGALRAYHNLCRHRGTRLCNEESGTLQGKIQCPYHAWTYELDGRLRRAPHMESVAGFEAADYPLHALAADVWDGHLFVSFARGPAPLAEQLAGLPERFAPWGMADLVRVERRRYVLRANWKLILQNYSECLHCPVAHPQLQRLSHYMSGDNEPPQPTYLGGRMDLRDGVGSLTRDGRTDRRPLPGLSVEDRRHVYYYVVLPNLLLNLHPDYVLTFRISPRAVDETEIVCDWLFHPDEVARPGFDPSDAVEFWEMTNRQDWELSERAQAGIRSRAYVPGPYSNREELLWALDRMVLRAEEEA
ncbi:MAG: aromatic ring-hydroxylating dioxygenase subunit alpha, partial [Acidobacteriota bacterium]